MEQQLNTLILLIQELIRRTTYRNTRNITSTFSKNDGFFLYVGVSGTLSGIDINGGSFTSRTFTAGYHPVELKSVTLGTATDCSANWNP